MGHFCTFPISILRFLDWKQTGGYFFCECQHAKNILLVSASSSVVVLVMVVVYQYQSGSSTSDHTIKWDVTGLRLHCSCN